MRRAAAVGREGEAPDSHGAAALGAFTRVSDRACRELAPALGDELEALRPGSLQRDSLPYTGERGAATVRLLEREPRLFYATRRANDRRWVNVGGQGQRDRRKRLLATAPSAPDRHAEARG